MAFSRFKRFRRPFRRPFRRRRAIRPVTRPQRWEFANFYTAQTIIVVDNIEAGGYTTNLNLELVKISEHLGATGSATGLPFMQTARKIEVGGIVWSCEVNYLDDLISDALVYMPVWEYMLVDRLDDSDAADPMASSIPNFLAVNTPVRAAATSIVADTSVYDTEWPDRFMFRDHWMMPIGSQNNARTDTQNQRSTRVRNLRVRKAIDDSQGLYLGCAVYNPSSVDVNVTITLRGTLYYRVVIGH